MNDNFGFDDLNILTKLKTYTEKAFSVFNVQYILESKTQIIILDILKLLDFVLIFR